MVFAIGCFFVAGLALCVTLGIWVLLTNASFSKRFLIAAPIFFIIGLSTLEASRWVLGRYREQEPASSATSGPNRGEAVSRLTGRVAILHFEPIFARFYQEPPVSYDPINCALYISLTNDLGKPLYVHGYEVSLLVDGRWTALINLPPLGLQSDEIGILAADTYSRIDLSLNGFDFLMRQKPLDDEKEVQAWMFFQSPLSPEQQQRVQSVRISILDNSDQWHTFFSDVPSNHPTTSNIVGGLKLIGKHPRPPNL